MTLSNNPQKDSSSPLAANWERTRGGTQPMTHDNPPLMAETQAERLLRSLAGYHVLFNEDLIAVVEFFKAYAAQQIAAKDARIAELEDRLEASLRGRFAERDALQAQLDTANAQLAMVVDAGQYLIDGIHYSEASPTYMANKAWAEEVAQEGSAFDNAVKNMEYALNQTQTTTEQWLADRDAALLKPWREGVQVLREACMSVFDEKTENALKATEGMR